MKQWRWSEGMVKLSLQVLKKRPRGYRQMREKMPFQS